jgi:hypothetical protein
MTADKSGAAGNEEHKTLSKKVKAEVKVEMKI